jgi:hypothetical protein
MSAIGITETCAIAAATGIQQHDAVAVVRDEDATVPVNLQAVRFAFVLGDQIPIPVWRNAEDAPEGNVHHVQAAVAVK